MKKSSKIVIGIVFSVLMIVVLFIVNHYFLNGLQIGLQAIVSGLIATIFLCIYMFCIWRK